MFVTVGHTAVPLVQTRGCGLVVGSHTAALVGHTEGAGR